MLWGISGEQPAKAVGHGKQGHMDTLPILGAPQGLDYLGQVVAENLEEARGVSIDWLQAAAKRKKRLLTKPHPMPTAAERPSSQKSTVSTAPARVYSGGSSTCTAVPAHELQQGRGCRCCYGFMGTVRRWAGDEQQGRRKRKEGQRFSLAGGKPGGLWVTSGTSWISPRLRCELEQTTALFWLSGEGPTRPMVFGVGGPLLARLPRLLVRRMSLAESVGEYMSSSNLRGMRKGRWRRVGGMHGGFAPHAFVATDPKAACRVIGDSTRRPPRKPQATLCS